MPKIDARTVKSLFGIGVYLIKDATDGRILYVGRSSRVGARLFSGTHHIISILERPFIIHILPCKNEARAAVMERRLARKYRPEYNRGAFEIGYQPPRAAVQTGQSGAVKGKTAQRLCLCCKAPLAGKQEKYCCGACKAEWHRRAKERRIKKKLEDGQKKILALITKMFQQLDKDDDIFLREVYGELEETHQTTENWP